MGRLKWLAASDELNGRPYWLISLAGLAVASAVLGNPRASIVWGCALILPGSLLFLYSARQKSLWVFPIIGAFFLSGLPVSLVSSGWVGLFNSHNLFQDVVLWLAVVILLAGYLHHAFHEGDRLAAMERWVQTAYPIGLAFILAACLIIALIGWPGIITVQYWWAGMSTMAVSAGLWFVYDRFQGVIPADTPNYDWAAALLQKIGSALSAVLSFDWLYQIVWFIFGLIQKIVQLLAAFLEGDGGVLWALLLLALLITLLQSGGQP